MSLGESMSDSRHLLCLAALFVVSSGCGRVGYDASADQENDAASVVDAAELVDGAPGFDGATTCDTGTPPFGCIQQSSGLRFDGTQFVEIPHAPELNLGAGSSTTEAWIQADMVAPATHTVLSKRTPGDIASGFMFGLLIDGGVWTQFNGAPNYFSDSGPNLLDAQWHHIAAVREELSPTSSEVRLYVDGVLVRTYTPEPLRNSTTTNSVLIGSDANTQPAFVGVIHNVRMWSVARTQQEISESRFQPLSGNEPGLRAAWPLDEGSGQVANELKGANPGTLGNSSAQDNEDPSWVSVP